MNVLKRLSKVPGIKLTVWTAREGTELDLAEAYLRANDIPYDLVNENPVFFKKDARKIFYILLLDDRAGLESAYQLCIDFLEWIEVR